MKGIRTWANEYCLCHLCKMYDSHDLTFFGDYVSVTIYTIIIGLLFQSFIQCDINMDLKLSV